MKNKSQLKFILFSFLSIVLAVPFALLVLEGALRLKNMPMKNYEIEMWRYAKELKIQSSDPILGHEHKNSSSAVLQSVKIRTNELGIRGSKIPESRTGQPIILFLGSSITLGWGVAEEETITGQTDRFLKEDGFDAIILNGGIGNYNSERYVQLFLTKLNTVNPTDIVVHFFLRDAEVLEPTRGNWFLRNSQLGVTLWNIYQQSAMAKKGVTVESHYKELYSPNHPGYKKMLTALSQLRDYAKQKNIRLYLAMTPDVHNLSQYPFSFIHEQMRQVSTALGYQFVDLYPALKGLKPEEIWSMPGDPHPNAYGHKKMAEAVIPLLEQKIFGRKLPFEKSITPNAF